MGYRGKPLIPLDDRDPLRVMFVITSMPVGGAEMLTAEVIRRLDRRRFAPALCCLKEPGPLGEKLDGEVPVFSNLLAGKYDLRVMPRLVRLLRRRRVDAVVTVDPGDKMFWGRLSAWWCGVPVVCSALHSTGDPHRVEWLNRRLAPITDAFVAVAEPQARYLAEHEGCPAEKIRVIPNGADLERFHPCWPSRALQEELAFAPKTPVVGIVAALRPEKNHELFLQAAALVHQQLPQTRFLIAGDGLRRAALQALAGRLALGESVRFLGTRSDVPDVLAALDVFAITSHKEANPVSILEAMATEKPVVATRVGSVSETVLDGKTGYLVDPGDAPAIAARVLELLRDPARTAAMGRAGREHVISNWSIERTVEGYQNLLSEIYASKLALQTERRRAAGARLPVPD